MKKQIFTIAAVLIAAVIMIHSSYESASASFRYPKITNAKKVKGRYLCPRGWTPHKERCYKCPDTHPYYNTRQGRCNSR